MKRKQGNERVRSVDPDVLAPLAAYGEQFMSMFDDFEEQQGQAAKQPRLLKQQEQQQQPGTRPKPASTHSSKSDASSNVKGSNVGHQHADEQLASHAAASALPGAAVAVNRRKRKAEAAARTAAATAAAAAAAAAPPLGNSKLDAFLSKRKGLNSSNAAHTPSQEQLQAQQQQREQQRLLEKQLKKQFMSAKVSKIFNDVDASQLAAAAAAGQQQDEDASLTPEAFAQMRRDVELLGASALDKRAAKAWRAAMLARLGAAADKAPRTPAKVGVGMAKKAKQREAAALQEAIAAGMVQAKGRGKKARALKAKERDRGLMEAGPGFKNGVLRLRKSTKPQQSQQQQQRQR